MAFGRRRSSCFVFFIIYSNFVNIFVLTSTTKSNFILLRFYGGGEMFYINENESSGVCFLEQQVDIY